MKNWGNWSYDELKSVIDTARKNNRKFVAIDQEHTDFINDKQVEI